MVGETCRHSWLLVPSHACVALRAPFVSQLFVAPRILYVVDDRLVRALAPCDLDALCRLQMSPTSHEVGAYGRQAFEGFQVDVVAFFADCSVHSVQDRGQIAKEMVAGDLDVSISILRQDRVKVILTSRLLLLSRFIDE